MSRARQVASIFVRVFENLGLQVIVPWRMCGGIVTWQAPMPEHSRKSRSRPRMVFVWSARNAPKVNWWRGLVGLQTRGGKDRGFVLHVAFKGMLLWSGSLALVCFIVATAVGAYVLNKNPYNRISYADLVLPTRWSELREKRGQTLIDQGLQEMKAQRYGAGIMMLAHGLRLEPKNIPARLVLTQVQVQSGYVHRGMQLLEDGIPWANGQKRYLEATFGLANYLEDDSRILKMVEMVRASLASADSGQRRWLRDQEAAALVRQARYQDVIALWESAKNEPSLGLSASWARAMSGLGKGDEAIAAIEADPTRFGVFGEPNNLLIELALANDRPDVGRAAVQSLLMQNPTDFEAAISQILYLAKIDSPDEWESAVDRFFLRFGLDETARVALLKKIEPVANIGLVTAVWTHMEVLGQISSKARMAYVQDLIISGEVARAEREFELAKKELNQSERESANWVKGTRLLLDVLRTGADSSFSLLQTFCMDNPLNPAAYRMMVTGLLKNDLRQQAGEMAMMAQNRYPSIRGIPDIELEEAAIGAEEMLASKREEKAEKRVTNPEARLAWASLIEDIQAARWGEAAERLEQLEQSHLAKEFGDDLLYSGLLVYGQLSRQTDLSWTMRGLMDRKGFDPSRLRALANTLHGSGRTDSGLTLLRELLRKYPEARWASDLRQQWLDELRTAPLESTPTS